MGKNEKAYGQSWAQAKQKNVLSYHLYYHLYHAI